MLPALRSLAFGSLLVLTLTACGETPKTEITPAKPVDVPHILVDYNTLEEKEYSSLKLCNNAKKKSTQGCSAK